jgi:plastocyanin
VRLISSGYPVCGVGTALLAAGHASASSAARIDIHNFKYAPATLTVRVGTTVTWTNHDEDPHTVTSATGAFTSAGLSHDETFAQTFTRPGTYQYFCEGRRLDDVPSNAGQRGRNESGAGALAGVNA